MNPHHLPRWLALALITLGYLSLPTRADTRLIDTVELMVADSDLVVKATIEKSNPSPLTNGAKLTLHVDRVLKGKADDSIECVVLYPAEERELPTWIEKETPLLICMVNYERSRFGRLEKEPPAPWQVRETWNTRACMIPLDGTAATRAPTLDFAFLTKEKDLLESAKKAADADAATKIPRQKDGSVASIQLEVPFGSPIEQQLPKGFSGTCIVAPLNELTESNAKEWIKSKHPQLVSSGIRALSHFKSDENIAALKKLAAIDPGSLNESYQKDLRDQASKAIKAWKNEERQAATQPQSDTPGEKPTPQTLAPSKPPH